MRYEIFAKSDLLTGATLTVAISEGDFDKKALYTIEEDRPKFILPFSHRRIDGKVVFIYQIGSHSRLRYFAGSRSAQEYADLWSGVLNPLLNCGDWFMKPYSFVLSAEYLYYDKKSKAIKYVYVPSISNCSDNADLKEMAAEISKLISVTDAKLENMALRSIMKNFDPQDFLQMLNKYSAELSFCSNEAADKPAGPDPGTLAAEKAPSADADTLIRAYNGPAGDIIIDIPDKVTKTKKRKRFEIGNGDRFLTEKQAYRRPGALRGLFGRDKETFPETKFETAAAHSTFAEPSAAAATAGRGSDTDDSSDVTQSLYTGASGARLRCVGRASLPAIIDVQIEGKEFFSIGRYDSAVGKQQSSFEFDRRTKAVSRRHAVIERDAEGYSIIDLASNSGTFVNGHKLPPNTRCKLERGCSVSFGNSGADYVWEE